MSLTKGDLEVLVHNATGLRDVEMFGRQDPFCVLTCGSLQYRTNTHTDGGRNPIWNQFFSFSNIDKGMALKVEIFDENLILRNVKIGSCQVILKTLKDGGAEQMVVPVTSSKGKQRGVLQVTLTFKPSSASIISVAATSGTLASSSSATPPPPPGDWLLPTYANTSVWKDYEAGSVLGKGTFGTTYAAVDRKTAEKVAVKVVSKKKLTRPEEIEDIQREVQILHQLRGFENVVQLKGQGIYEDKQNVSIVMEQCTGGELFDAIVKRGKYSEKEAAGLIRTIVDVVAHCNNMNVIHRDLKPENFLFSDSSPGAVIKVIDFGLSAFYKDGQVFTDTVGSPYYLAPEVLKKHYGKEADMWSCGVILYILLSGFPPFHGQGEKQIFQAVLTAPIDFTSHPWPRISDPAKDCVRRMLVRDPKKRATPGEILNHEWMRENGVASDVPLESEVLLRIKQFSDGNRLKKEALKLIVRDMPPEEIEGLRSMFQDMDTDDSGSITTKEFVDALKRKGCNSSEEELASIMQAADVNGDGTIDYEEFLAVMLNKAQKMRVEVLKKAFDEFDLNKDGTITREELRLCLKNAQVQDVENVIKELDKNGDGCIDFPEFVAMFS